MGCKLKHLMILAAILCTLLTVFVPVAKDYHVAMHCSNDVSINTITEKCLICDFEFSNFENSENIEIPVTVQPIVSLYVPSNIGQVYVSELPKNVIRGPPEV